MEIQEIKALINSGKSVREVSKISGISQRAVRAISTRPPGQKSKYGEKTKVMRIPVSKVELVEEFLRGSM